MKLLRKIHSRWNRIVLLLAEQSTRARENTDKKNKFFSSLLPFVYGSIVFTALLVFGGKLQDRYHEIKSSRISVSFSQDRWKVLSPSSNTERFCSGSVTSRDCPAHPENTEANLATHSRADADHSKQVRSYGKEPFWLIYDVTEAEAQTAALAQANEIFIGILNGDYSIYANGILMKEHQGKTERNLIALTIPLQWLSKPLRIAIKLENKSVASFPDIFEASGYGPTGMGTSRHLDGLQSLANFNNENAHWLLFLTYFLVSAFFISLWVATPGKDELFYFSIFTLILSLISLRLTFSFYLQISRVHCYQIEVLLRLAEGAAGLWTGASIARINKRIPLIFSSVILAFGFFQFSRISEPANYLELSATLAQYTVPVCYLLAGIFCHLQRSFLQHQMLEKNHFRFKTRANRLLIFETIFFLLALIQAFQAQWTASPGMITAFTRQTPLLAVLTITYILLQEFREQSLQFESVPLSRFHRMNPVPDSVSGYVMDIDLKGSERLYKAAAGLPNQNALVQPYIEAWMTIARLNGGEVISFEGDMIRVLYEDSNPNSTQSQETLLAVWSTLQQIEKLMPQITADLIRGHGEEFKFLFSSTPEFRSVISYGALKPNLMGSGPNRLPTWTNADAQHVLLRVSRLALAESLLFELDGPSGTTKTMGNNLILDEETLPEASYRHLIEHLTFNGFECKATLKPFLESKKTFPPTFTWVKLGSASGTPVRQTLKAT